MPGSHWRILIQLTDFQNLRSHKGHWKYLGITVLFMQCVFFSVTQQEQHITRESISLMTFRCHVKSCKTKQEFRVNKLGWLDRSIVNSLWNKFNGEKNNTKLPPASTGLSGASWQVVLFSVYLRFLSMLTSPRFLIGYTSHSTVCVLFCCQGTPHILRYWVKTIQHVLLRLPDHS